ncbi:MAG: hypothetical protein Q9206_001284 [Seirophora lacunosa]
MCAAEIENRESRRRAIIRKKIDGPSAPDRISCEKQTERSNEPGDKEASGGRLPFQQRQKSEKKVQGARNRSRPKPELPQFLKDSLKDTLKETLKENRPAMSQATQARRHFQSDDIISMISGRGLRQRDPNAPTLQASQLTKPPADSAPGLQEYPSPPHEAKGTQISAPSPQLPRGRTATPKNLPTIQAEDSPPPTPVGTWDATDAFAKPARKTLTHDLYRSRPPNVISFALPQPTVDKNTKHVPQMPIAPNCTAEVPPFPKTVQTPEKVTNPYPGLTSVIGQVNDPSSDFTALSSPSNNPATVTKKDPANQLTSPEIAQDHKKPPISESKGILRYFSPVTPRQGKPEHPATMTAVPAATNNELSTRAPTPATKPTKGGLLTNGSDFVTLALATHRNRPSHKAEESTVPAEASAEALGSSVDEVMANVNAKTVASLESVKPHSSNESVRGRADIKMSTISGSLNFDDAFQGRNASVASHKSVVLYQGRQANNPYQPGNQVHDPNLYGGWEDGQLHGWDGKWAPAPVEWDLRELYDYRKPQHRESIKNFVLDRYKAFKNGGCPALGVEGSEDFTSGASLAVGLAHFGSRINPNQHHHIRATDPFTLNKVSQTAANSIENYCRYHKDRLQQKEEKKKAKRVTQEERDEMAKKHAEVLRNMPPNPFKPVANIYIRPARPKDLFQIQAIHNHYTRTSAVTQERVEFGQREIRSLFDQCANEKYPFIVAISRHGRTAQKNEIVVGFAYAEDYGGETTMWRHTCEVAFYVDARHLRKGIGKNLLDTLLRGVTPYYHYHNGVQFDYAPAEYDRHDGGGARIISQIMVPFPYFADEEAKHEWMGPWLAREFEFEHQGTLKGVGHAGTEDKP